MPTRFSREVDGALLRRAADWLALAEAPDRTPPDAARDEWPAQPVPVFTAGGEPPLADIGPVDPLQAVEFAVNAGGASKVEIAGDWTGWAPVPVPGPGEHRSVWFSLAEGRHAYQWVLDGKPVPDPGGYGEVGISSKGPFSVISAGKPSCWLRVKNPLPVTARVSTADTPDWLSVRCEKADIASGESALLQLRADPATVPVVLDEALDLVRLQPPQGSPVVGAARVRVRMQASRPAYLPEAVQWTPVDGRLHLLVRGRALGSGRLRMRLREARSLRVLAEAELRHLVQETNGASVLFGPLATLATQRGRVSLVLDTGSAIENRRRFLLSLPPLPGLPR